MVEALLSALANLATLQHILHLVLGVMLGLAIGAFPGLGGIAGLSIMVPFLYGMDTVSALATLVGLVAVIPTSDTFTSILMGIPGSSASQATVLDGFPLAQKGEASRALSAAFSASLMGGIVGAIILTLFVQVARPLILTFGSAELFMLALLGLSMVGVLSGASLVKGISACGLGLILGSIGGAPATGEFRMTFGIDYFYDGLPLIIVGIGLFAFPEITELLRKNRPIAAGGLLAGKWFDGIRDVFKNWFLCLRCAGIGTLIGAIPGLGGSVVDWIAYGHVVQTAKDKSQFGKGDIRGVLAPESANNAKEGGGLVPTLLFGIPGSGAMAVFLGGMVLLGIEAGPAMVSTNLDLTYTIIWSLALANIIGAGSCIFLARPISRLTAIPFNFLAPFMIMVISFAAFQATRQFMDLIALLGIGILGIALKRFGWSRPAFLIGFVLAPQAEGYLNLAVQFYSWNMFARPGVLIIFGITVASVWFSSRGRGRNTENIILPVDGSSGTAQSSDRTPQMLFLIGSITTLSYAIWSSQQLSPLGSMFPFWVALGTMVLCIYQLLSLKFGSIDNPVNFDLENHTSDPTRGSIISNAGWFAVLIAITGLVGFQFGVLFFFMIFLKLKANQNWRITIALSITALAIISSLANLLIVELPTGLLSQYINLPWFLGQG
ncbi:MAG: tripartite tricarboxylate transporter permease [Gammaproteobacteria bacterium]|nr:tripartite tricarboxylate transporter permease [Gammaproteobacteria bacterium]